MAIRCLTATEQNIGALVREVFGANPAEVDVLAVDIDADDCPVARAALEAFAPNRRPRAVVLESQSFPPPPMGWAMEQHPRLSCGSETRQGRCFYLGCSLGYQVP